MSRHSESNTTAALPRVYALLMSMCTLSLTPLWAGCGHDGPDRVEVSGKVTFDGAPVQSGRIWFRPQPGSHVPPAGAWISNGQYHVTHHGGVPVGAYTVEITARRPVPGFAISAEEAAAIDEDVPTQQYIPARYNAESTLTFIIEEGSRDITENNYDITM